MTKQKRKTKSSRELIIENNFLRKQRKVSAMASVLQSLIKWAGLLGIAYFAFRSIEALAGKVTFADIGIDFLAKIKVSVGLAWTFGTGGVFYGLRQNALKKRAIARFEKRNTQLEKLVDPNRTSSGLTLTGETHPDDE